MHTTYKRRSNGSDDIPLHAHSVHTIHPCHHRWWCVVASFRVERSWRETKYFHGRARGVTAGDICSARLRPFFSLCSALFPSALVQCLIRTSSTAVHSPVALQSFDTPVASTTTCYIEDHLVVYAHKMNRFCALTRFPTYLSAAFCASAIGRLLNDVMLECLRAFPRRQPCHPL